jgi:UDP-N-acetylglucosamine 2-epimerase (non-hydrolysing)
MSDLLIVVGARPNFMKAASIVQAARQAGLTCTLLHTGQHYDPQLSRVFFEELGLPEPDISLGIGSASHAVQTAKIMLAFEGALRRVRPSVVVVVGDVNSTLACALVAVKEQVPVAHVEAGLRCFDRSMPEEVNRRLCDHVSTYLFTTSRDCDENLAREGVAPEGVHFVGNTMIDTLLRFRPLAAERRTAEGLGVDGRYCVLTLHRAETVDDEAQLGAVLEAILPVGEVAPVVFPIHPRTRDRIAGTRLETLLAEAGRLVCTSSLGYLDFVGLTAGASLVLTDSGGIQEETTVLGVPCLTLRPSTERPVTVACGTNRVIGTDPETITREALATLAAPPPAGAIPELWDGRAGERIAERLRAEIYAGLPAVAIA